MEYAFLGKTGKKVSRIGFGGAVIGLKNYLQAYDPAAEKSLRDFLAAVDKGLELGINYFDTAPGYGEGASERMFGTALAGVDPSRVFLATKVSPGNRDHVMQSLENSLTNLKRDKIDLLQVHGDTLPVAVLDQILAPSGMLAGLEEARRSGLVDAIGFTSEDNNDVVYRLIGSGRFDTMQICYNFLFQHPYEPSRPFGSILAAEKAAMGIITMRTPTSGTFQRWIQQVNPENTFDYTPALIQFVLSNPLVDVALIGMRTPDLVQANVDICNDLSGRVDLEAIHQRYV